MIGIGIIGAGHFGAIHAEAIQRLDGLRVVAASRRNSARLAEFCAHYDCRQVADWRDLIKLREVDAVAIATPHDQHAEIAIAAARAGKHVLLEKPMAPTVADCDRIIAAATDAGVQLLVGHTMQFTLPVLRAKSMIAEGVIGKPRIGRAVMVKQWMAPNRQPWHLEDQSGGGMLLTAGIHALDTLVGVMDEPVTSVTAFMGTAFHQQSADDYAHLVLNFESGAFGHVDSIGYKDGAGSRWTEIIGEDGALRIDPVDGVSIGRNDAWQHVEGSNEPDTMKQAIAREWEALRNAVLDGETLPISARYAADIVKIIEEARASSQ